MKKKIPIEKTCEYCGKTFTAKRSTDKYCSVECSKIVMNKKKQEYREIKKRQTVAARRLITEPIDPLPERRTLSTHMAGNDYCYVPPFITNCKCFDEWIPVGVNPDKVDEADERRYARQNKIEMTRSEKELLYKEFIHDPVEECYD